MKSNQQARTGSADQSAHEYFDHLVTAGRETGFGGGVLIYAEDTGNFLWIKRSDEGDEPGTWCVPGGGIEDYETIDQGVHRECEEEIGYDQPMNLLHMHRDVQPSFIFHNHMATVPQQFEPVLNEEHTDYRWSADPPQPLHPRLAFAMEQWRNRTNATQ